MAKQYKTFFKKAWKDDPETFTAIFAEDEDFEFPLRTCAYCGKISCSSGTGLNACSKEDEQLPNKTWLLIGRSYGRVYTKDPIPKEIIATDVSSPFSHKAAIPTDPTSKKAKGRASKKKKDDGTW